MLEVNLPMKPDIFESNQDGVKVVWESANCEWCERPAQPRLLLKDKGIELWRMCKQHCEEISDENDRILVLRKDGTWVVEL